jgi:GNAT superfamily N-acetyltransferase
MRDELLEFELALDLEVSDEVVTYDWGRAFLCPTLPLVWDLNWMLIEQEGMSAEEVIGAADETLARFQHRTIAIRGEAEGTRLAREFEGVSDWEVESTIYMVWRGETGRQAQNEIRETTPGGCEELRRKLIRSGLPPESDKPEETTEQLLEMDRRFGAAGAARWFVAPPEDPASACCLFSADGIGQVEEVMTLPAARGRGLAQATTLAAIAASQKAGHRVTFLGADADDWPRLLYEKLGFETCGTMHVLRRTRHQG